MNKYEQYSTVDLMDAFGLEDWFHVLGHPEVAKRVTFTLTDDDFFMNVSDDNARILSLMGLYHELCEVYDEAGFIASDVHHNVYRPGFVSRKKWM